MREDDDDIQEYINYRDAFPKEKFIVPASRNDVLEEVAQRFDQMINGGDTAASFAAYVRSMKDYGVEE
jgi:dihydroneopterin aldolase